MAPSANFPSNRLKTIVIVAAFLQIIVFVIIMTSYIFFSGEIILDTWFVIVYYVVNIVFAGYFIYKAFLNEPRCFLYEMVLFLNVAILVSYFQFDYAVLALFEFYIYCCTNILGWRYKKSLLNDPETPPLTYNSCNKDGQIPFAGPSSQSDAQVNSAANTETVSDTHVDPPKYTTETLGLNGSVK